jgi:hypothetical protein
MHIREFGLFCIRLQEPVQHPLLLVGSVRLTMYGCLMETYPSGFDAMSEAILATSALLLPDHFRPCLRFSALRDGPVTNVNGNRVPAANFRKVR